MSRCDICKMDKSPKAIKKKKLTCYVSSFDRAGNINNRYTIYVKRLLTTFYSINLLFPVIKTCTVIVKHENKTNNEYNRP